ncbi:AGE family epimerase/isomerase [Pseudomonas silvicola]|nr:AGE family epimerase/isomerase [Pseudomonas silvicola]
MADHGALSNAATEGWRVSARHRRWLEQQGQRLLDFSKHSVVPDGFAALDTLGELPAHAQAQVIITARMTHAYALAALQGLPGSTPLVDHGLKALAGPLKDHAHGGWDDGSGRKMAYAHAFVALAAATATIAGRPGARELLSDVTAIIERHFWSQEEGVQRDSFALDWSDEEDYRGANSNMHSVEAFMTIADALDQPVWRTRALRICERFIHQIASAHDFCVVEHFDRQWRILHDYHHDQPDHDLRPYGMTPGHFVEWAHLLLKLEAALAGAAVPAPDWLAEHAAKLFEAGVAYGWAADGAPGLVYTIGWDRKPHMRHRVHWAHAEAITAASALLDRTGRQEYEQWYQTFWDYLDLYLIDRDNGSWHNELDEYNRPKEQVYQGKADLYHAYQATLTPLLPLAPCLAESIRQGVKAFS